MKNDVKHSIKRVRQVIFREVNSDMEYCGIEYKNIVICGCCGCVFKKEEIMIVESFIDWVDIQEGIEGN